MVRAWWILSCHGQHWLWLTLRETSHSKFTEAIDEGHNKEALQLANKILKKTPDYTLVKVNIWFLFMLFAQIEVNGVRTYRPWKHWRSFAAARKKRQANYAPKWKTPSLQMSLRSRLQRWPIKKLVSVGIAYRPSAFHRSISLTSSFSRRWPSSSSLRSCSEVAT